jgi:hypothetical protein
MVPPTTILNTTTMTHMLVLVLLVLSLTMVGRSILLIRPRVGMAPK